MWLVTSSSASGISAWTAVRKQFPFDVEIAGIGQDQFFYQTHRTDSHRGVDNQFCATGA